MQYLFDTSAIVKLYHQELGSDRVLPLYRDGEVIVISELSKVELLSTIHKKPCENLGSLMFTLH